MKIFANRYHILKLKRTKLDFGWGAYSAAIDPQLDSKGEENGKRGNGYGKGGGSGREEEENMDRDRPPTIFGLKVAQETSKLAVRVHCVTTPA